MINSHQNRIANIATALLLSGLSLLPNIAAAAPEAVTYVAQGKKWTAADRQSFYSQDQGSELMPLKWFQALKQPNGEPFSADSLSRYGYLPNDASPTPGLPVGFTTHGDNVGMTCAACHVRQINVDNRSYRIDGGPAIADFQSFAADLGQAVNVLLTDPDRFNAFAAAVLGKAHTSRQQAQLRQDVQAWYLPYSTIMDNALPKDHPWGPVRLDAVGMIFNRLTGLDIGTSPDHIIAENIHLADAPVRYPFLWNAAIQDKTQWPGFADNGNAILGLSRNLGEVIGVFAHFAPQKDDWRVLGVDYLNTNSANFNGLKNLETLIRKIGPPKWPWQKGPLAINQKLAKQGKAIFDSTTQTEAGGCAGCHGIRQGTPRFLQKTWATPLCDVKTDGKEFELLQWQVDSGVLAGAQIPFLNKPLQAKNELAFNVLTVAVLGSILQHDSKILMDLETIAKREAAKFEHLVGIEKTEKLKQKAAQLRKMQAKLINPTNADLKGAFNRFSQGWQSSGAEKSICKDTFTDKEPAQAFESRVLEGIWAAAPYLHNGSVPTLADLLKPASKRPASFKIGANYDLTKVGLAAEQSQFDYVLQTTDCSDPNSGNSRCGHEFGTHLTDDEKKALLEYMKSL